MASPERRLPHPCLKTSWPGLCRNCHAPGATHSPVFHRGNLLRCMLPLLFANRASQPRAATPGPRPPEAPKPAPKQDGAGRAVAGYGLGKKTGRSILSRPYRGSSRAHRIPRGPSVDSAQTAGLVVAATAVDTSFRVVNPK